MMTGQIPLEVLKSPYHAKDDLVSVAWFVWKEDFELFKKRFPKPGSLQSIMSWGFYSLCRRIQNREAGRPPDSRIYRPGERDVRPLVKRIMIALPREEIRLYRRFDRRRGCVVNALAWGWREVIKKIESETKNPP